MLELERFCLPFQICKLSFLAQEANSITKTSLMQALLLGGGFDFLRRLYVHSRTDLFSVSPPFIEHMGESTVEEYFSSRLLRQNRHFLFFLP